MNDGEKKIIWQLYINNKFVRSMLVAYYMFTRNVHLKQALREISSPAHFETLFEECILYHSGETVNREEGETYDIMPPVGLSLKAASGVLSACVSDQDE